MPLGDLVLVGGAEDRAHAAIVRRFVKLAGGTRASFAVLPSASEDPRGGFERMQNWLTEAGVNPGLVTLLEVSAMVPQWREGAHDPVQVALAAQAEGIWLLGGDQNRMTALLIEADGSDSPLLAAIRAAHSRGAVLGGTSAGAAVMSDPMIGGGTSFGALALPHANFLAEEGDGRALQVSPGLGFFPCGMVDQHFDTQPRLGRLLEAAMVEDGASRFAFGIAEATALVYRRTRREITVLGAGGVLVVDPRWANRSLLDGRVRIEGAILHYLREGDRLSLEDERMAFPHRMLIDPQETSQNGSGIIPSSLFSVGGALDDLAAKLMLHKGAGQILVDQERNLKYTQSYFTGGTDGCLLAWEARLGCLEGRSRLWFGDGYSFEDVNLDLLPVEIESESQPVGPERSGP